MGVLGQHQKSREILGQAYGKHQQSLFHDNADDVQVEDKRRVVRRNCFWINFGFQFVYTCSHQPEPPPPQVDCMPRRPRPTTRKPPKTSPYIDQHASSALAARKTKAKSSVKAVKRPEPIISSSSSSDSEENGPASEVEDNLESDNDENNVDESVDEEDIDVDAPRVAQWVGEDEFDSQAGSVSSEGEESEEEASDFEEGSSTGVNMVRMSIL